MGKLPHMNDKLLRRCKALIRERCCNYDHGCCLALDDGESCPCVQSISNSLLCKWFRLAVLPTDPELEAEVLIYQAEKECCICGKTIYSSSNRAKYCPDCSRKERRRKEAERLHKHYLKSRI